MDYFNFGSSFNSGIGVDYGAYFNATPSLGSGFVPVTSNNYDDHWIESDMHRYVGSPVTVNVSGVGAPAKQSVYSINDLNSGLFSAASVGLQMLTNHASVAATTVVQQIPHTMSGFESQVMKTVVGLPNIAGGIISLGQVAHSYIANDVRGVYTNAANFFGGAAGATVAMILGPALGIPVAGTVGAVFLAGAGGGILLSMGAGALHDLATGNGMSEDRMDKYLAGARQGINDFFNLNPYAAGVREWSDWNR